MTEQTINQMFDEASKTLDYAQEGLKLEFLESLLRVMKKRKINKAQLAELLGTTKSRVTYIFQGGNLSMATVTKIAHALGCKIKLTITNDNRTTSQA